MILNRNLKTIKKERIMKERLYNTYYHIFFRKRTDLLYY